MTIAYKDVRQGSQEWLQMRAGIPTASNFSDIITKSGTPSKSAEKYALRLLAERLMGHPITEHISFWMERGSEMEKTALDFYRMHRDCDTEYIGFVTNDAGTIGASPDAFVGDDGALEIKCRKEDVHMSLLLNTGTHADMVKVQAQGQLWICERQWVDILAFHPELPPAVQRIERDEEFIRMLAGSVTAFSVHLEAMAQDLAKRGWMKPIREPQSEQDRLIQSLRDSLIDLKKPKEQVTA